MRTIILIRRILTIPEGIPRPVVVVVATSLSFLPLASTIISAWLIATFGMSTWILAIQGPRGDSTVPTVLFNTSARKTRESLSLSFQVPYSERIPVGDVLRCSRGDRAEVVYYTKR